MLFSIAVSTARECLMITRRLLHVYTTSKHIKLDSFFVSFCICRISEIILLAVPERGGFFCGDDKDSSGESLDENLLSCFFMRD